MLIGAPPASASAAGNNEGGARSFCDEGSTAAPSASVADGRLSSLTDQDFDQLTAGKSETARQVSSFTRCVLSNSPGMGISAISAFRSPGVNPVSSRSRYGRFLIALGIDRDETCQVGSRVARVHLSLVGPSRPVAPALVKV